MFEEARANRQLLAASAARVFVVNDRADYGGAAGSRAARRPGRSGARRCARDYWAGRGAGLLEPQSATARRRRGGAGELCGLRPVFSTASKQNPDPVVGLEELRAVPRADVTARWWRSAASRARTCARRVRGRRRFGGGDRGHAARRLAARKSLRDGWKNGNNWHRSRAPDWSKVWALLDATTLVMGSMIGSGIFIVAADIARQVNSPGTAADDVDGRRGAHASSRRLATANWPPSCRTPAGSTSTCANRSDRWRVSSTAGRCSW